MKCGSLLLFACALSVNAASVCDVTAYGAKNDASARSTKAIHDAIQACAKAGGGTVYFPAGTYETGAIELASNITLNIDAGATLRFHTELSEYPLVPGRSEGTEGLTPAPLIGGRNLQNIAITGRGTLTTDNAAWVRQANGNAEARAMWTSIQNRLENKETIPEADYRKAAPSLRPAMIRPMDSKNILIEGIHVTGSSFWTIHLLYCENVVVRNVIVETYPGANPDGIDIDSSREVRVSDSYFDTGDDAIVIKSGKGVDGRRVGKPSENITITNCTFGRAHGAVVVGSETAGGVRNVTASNIVAKGTEIGIRIKSGRSRGGVIENLRFDNWVIDNPVRSGILVTNYYVRIPEEPVSERTPVFRNISISNVTVSGAPIVIDIQGLPEMPIEGLRIRDVVGAGKRGLQAFNTKGLELHDVKIDAAEGPAFLIRDSSDVELDRVERDQGLTGMPVVRLDRVTRALIQGSRAWPGTGTFLSAAPGLLKSVVLDANDLAAAKAQTEESSMDYWQGIDSPDRGLARR
jgi:polygalacturonase